MKQTRQELRIAERDWRLTRQGERLVKKHGPKYGLKVTTFLLIVVMLILAAAIYKTNQRCQKVLGSNSSYCLD